jgi:hypothetical protein
MLSLDLGPLAFLPALVLGGLVATRGDASYGSAFGVLTGAGLPLLFVAYVQRDGPGTTCYRTAVATGCAQHLNPVPWLVVGITLVLAGLLTQKHRSRRVEITSAGSRCDGPWPPKPLSSVSYSHADDIEFVASVVSPRQDHWRQLHVDSAKLDVVADAPYQPGLLGTVDQTNDTVVAQ